MSQSLFDQIKAATVAVVAAHENTVPKAPFTVIGSGFCIHPRGVVVTCEHVHKCFVDPEAYKTLMEHIARSEDRAMEVKSVVPHVLFHSRLIGTEIQMPLVPIENAVSLTNFDLAVFKLRSHKAFGDNFPSIPIANYHEIHEMMEIGLCGYPLGLFLHQQLGTVTSSFTRGVVSSIIPAPGVALEHLRGFQLNLTATNGNSGGPVFSVATGRVFGVLQRGVVHPNGHIVQGLSKAEPIYPIFEHNRIDRILNYEKGQGRA